MSNCSTIFAVNELENGEQRVVNLDVTKVAIFTFND